MAHEHGTEQDIDERRRIIGAAVDDVVGARPRTVLFEAANPHHAHEWEVRVATDLPDDVILAPGVIVSTSNCVEHPRRVAQLLAPSIDLVGRERVIASTDGGLGTFAGIGGVDPDVVRTKMSSLVERAAMA